ncbi:oxidoreductase [Fulvitalea axinellae]|uniref:Oxidoreductase n=1 Tax=Fulvitalea axinellae TaxID=1182444 RepID=A0AAU9DA38_9BACT|nr:oxidoreductase [Fulvitalea axinellae]
MDLLSWIILVPLLAGAVILALPKERKKLYYLTALTASAIQLTLAVICCINFKSSITDGFAFHEKYDWITMKLGQMGTLSIDYHVGVDGINISLLLLSAIVMFFGTMASKNIEKKAKGYFSLLMILSASVAGCFVSLDFFLFYLFFEFMLLPMYFLIGIWGGPKREYAAIKFFLYTLFGSVLILISMIALYTSVIDPVETAEKLGLAGQQNAIELVQEKLSKGEISADNLVRTFDLDYMTDKANLIPDSLLSTLNTDTFLGLGFRMWAFLLILIGFAIKLPTVPFHTWLPDAHVQAPTAISVVLAGILLKIGGYGLLRTGYAIFPDGAIHFAWLIGLFGLISIVYGGLNALAQKDLKSLVAYSSVSHMGFVLLGLASLTTEGVQGAVYQMFSHGLIASLLFLIAGVVYDRTYDRMISNYSGLANAMPKYTTIVIIGFFASLGLPGFSGFIAELLVFLGAFGSNTINGLLPHWMAIVAVSGLVIGAAYYLWTLQRMFFGKYSVKANHDPAKMTDLSAHERMLMYPLAALTIVFGLFPNIIFKLTDADISALVKSISEWL